MMTAIEALKKYQKQLDAEGVEVGVSRQALDEVLHDYEQLQQQLSEANYALEKATDVIEEKGRERNKAILMLDEANEKLDKARECLKQIDYWNDDPKHFSKFLNDLLKQTLKDIE